MESERRRSADQGREPSIAARPAIPAEIARKVLFESGHRCAVCGAECPLERAHIIPWRDCKEHNLENLVCLCANCHARADLEKWSSETLRSYKNMPWVLRSRQNPEPAVKESASIILTVRMDLDQFDEKHQRFLRFAIASFLDISPDEVRIRKIEMGSVKVTFEVPAESIEELQKRDNLKAAAKMLQGVALESIEIFDELEDLVATTVETEEQVVARLWRDILGTEVKEYDNFFEAGGDSILMMSLRVRINDEFGVNLSASEFFQFPTISTQAERIRLALRETGVDLDGYAVTSGGEEAAGETSAWSNRRVREDSKTPNPGATADGLRRR